MSQHDIAYYQRLLESSNHTLAIVGNFSSQTGVYKFSTHPEKNNQAEKATAKNFFKKIRPEVVCTKEQSLWNHEPFQSIKMAPYKSKRENNEGLLTLEADNPLFAFIADMTNGESKDIITQNMGGGFLKNLVEALDILACFFSTTFSERLLFVVASLIPHINQEAGISRRRIFKLFQNEPLLGQEIFTYLTAYEHSKEMQKRTLQAVQERLNVAIAQESKTVSPKRREQEAQYIVEALLDIRNMLNDPANRDNLPTTLWGKFVKEYQTPNHWLKQYHNNTNTPAEEFLDKHIGNGSFISVYQTYMQASNAVHQLVRSTALYPSVFMWLLSQYYGSEFTQGEFEGVIDKAYARGVVNGSKEPEFDIATCDDWAEKIRQTILNTQQDVSSHASLDELSEDKRKLVKQLCKEDALAMLFKLSQKPSYTFEHLTKMMHDIVMRLEAETSDDLKAIRLDNQKRRDYMNSLHMELYKYALKLEATEKSSRARINDYLRELHALGINITEITESLEKAETLADMEVITSRLYSMVLTKNAETLTTKLQERGENLGILPSQYTESMLRFQKYAIDNESISSVDKTLMLPQNVSQNTAPSYNLEHLQKKLEKVYVGASTYTTESLANENLAKYLKDNSDDVVEIFVHPDDAEGDNKTPSGEISFRKAEGNYEIIAYDNALVEKAQDVIVSYGDEQLNYSLLEHHEDIVNKIKSGNEQKVTDVQNYVQGRQSYQEFRNDIASLYRSPKEGFSFIDAHIRSGILGHFFAATPQDITGIAEEDISPNIGLIIAIIRDLMPSPQAKGESLEDVIVDRNNKTFQERLEQFNLASYYPYLEEDSFADNVENQQRSAKNFLDLVDFFTEIDDIKKLFEVLENNPTDNPVNIIFVNNTLKSLEPSKNEEVSKVFFNQYHPSVIYLAKQAFAPDQSDAQKAVIVKQLFTTAFQHNISFSVGATPDLQMPMICSQMPLDDNLPFFIANSNENNAVLQLKEVFEKTTQLPDVGTIRNFDLLLAVSLILPFDIAEDALGTMRYTNRMATVFKDIELKPRIVNKAEIHHLAWLRDMWRFEPLHSSLFYCKLINLCILMYRLPNKAITSARRKEQFEDVSIAKAFTSLVGYAQEHYQNDIFPLLFSHPAYQHIRLKYMRQEADTDSNDNFQDLTSTNTVIDYASTIAYVPEDTQKLTQLDSQQAQFQTLMQVYHGNN